ncbi:MAG: TRAP transporter substrate-binding protein DctP [Treponema sp.]|nr:TRAP transporter substrate-binding protein DctP [Treponema sp.]
MKNYFSLFACVFFTFFCLTEAVFAQRGTGTQGELVKLASPLPRNTDWGRALDRMAGEWARVTNNAVRLEIIHDGREGTEARMLSSMATNNIQAAIFTSFGISDFCPAVMTMSIPFHIRNDNEFNEVFKEIQPILDAQIRRTNFHVVSWSNNGSVYIFSKNQVLVPDDLRRHRLASSPEATSMNSVFRAMRFNLVEADNLELGQRLASDMINAIYQIPLAVAPLRLHRSVPHMLDLPIAPVLGGIVINRVTWDKISPEHQRAITNVTQRIVAEFDATLPRANANALAMMRRDGLTVNQLNGTQEAQWRTLVETAMPSLLGAMYDRDIYNRINVILARIRSGR